MTSTRRGVGLKFLADVIPAQPGYFFVAAFLNADGTAYESLRTPVIAWALERSTFQPYPITIDGIQQGSPTIALPSGVIECIGRGPGEPVTYPSLAKWLEDAKYFSCEEKD